MTDNKLIEAMAQAILDSIYESCDIVPSEAMTAAQAAHAVVIAHAAAAIIDVRARNAGNFERKGVVWEAYDKAALDCYKAVAALSGGEPT
jgi:hypothetical protein